MRLTNTIRDAFVSAVMADVPYTDMHDLMQKVVNDAAKAFFLKTTGMSESEHKKLKDAGWLGNHSVYFNNWGYVYTTVPAGTKPAELGVVEVLEDLYSKKAAQDTVRVELRTKLRAAANSATTRAGLVKLLPEFEKYLPADETAACKTLPAIANVVADFTKAGWPKGKEPAEAPSGA